MKIEYRHFSNPTQKEIYDTEKSLKNNPFIHISQEEFDKQELKKMEEDKETGTIIDYHIIEEFNLE